MARSNDPLVQTRGHFVMIDRRELEGGPAEHPRCGSIHIGMRCQLINRHDGLHRFWKESPLISWGNNKERESIEEEADDSADGDGEDE